MNNQDDAVFVRNFALVLLALCVIAIGAFVLAKIVNSGAQESMGQAGVEQIAPAEPGRGASFAARAQVTAAGAHS